MDKLSSIGQLEWFRSRILSRKEEGIIEVHVCMTGCRALGAADVVASSTYCRARASGSSLATFGNAARRGDSRFHIDNTIVDLTVAPKQQNVRDLNQELMGLISGNADIKEKLQFLIDINEQDLWRRDMQIGTAHFNTPQFATHQFLNIMENPVGTLCYQGSRGMDVFRSYELRCIVNIVHPKNPHLSEGTRELAMYPSILYGLYHGLPEDGPNIPAALYCMNEEYDNSPGERPGLRVVPPLEE
jgi:hypothetical protein